MNPFHKPESKLSNSEVTKRFEKRERFKAHSKQTIIRRPLINQDKCILIICNLAQLKLFVPWS